MLIGPLAKVDHFAAFAAKWPVYIINAENLQTPARRAGYFGLEVIFSFWLHRLQKVSSKSSESAHTLGWPGVQRTKRILSAYLLAEISGTQG